MNLRASILQRLSPAHQQTLRQHWQRLIRPAWLGTLRRTTPLSDQWGKERGTPIDRYYIENFLAQHRSNIRGRVLEIKDSTYTRRFGSNVTQADILDINPNNPNATFIADLAAAEHVPANQFDCFVFTQTLHFIYDVRAAVAQIHRSLKPHGVLLATVPSIIRVERGAEMIDYWRFTEASCRKLFGDVFGTQHITVQSYGNSLVAVAFLEGLAHEELTRAELDTHDPYFPLVITVQAVKQTT